MAAGHSKPGASPQGSIRSPWFALRLRSRHEFAVRDALAAQGLEQFLPVWDETVQWTDRKTVTTRPLFAGYIFARGDSATRDAALRTRGVVEVLSVDGLPAPISEEVIADLRTFLASRAAVALGPYVAGVSVRVKSGPYAGVTGVVSRVKGATTLTIPFEMLGRSASVQIDAADVEAAV